MRGRWRAARRMWCLPRKRVEVREPPLFTPGAGGYPRVNGTVPGQGARVGAVGAWVYHRL
ncbi:hypothetical protein FMUBM48_35290 [Nocardia cyriacigeorgica]|nr:hypothetical protein FMUBM48_35290 [Nocardia cyriacigeorgica]